MQFHIQTYITYIFCRFFFQNRLHIETNFLIPFHHPQSRRAAQRIGTAHTKESFNVRKRVASDWCSTVKRMGALHDSYAWTTYSSISATNYESRVKLNRIIACACHQENVFHAQINYYILCYLRKLIQKYTQAILYELKSRCNLHCRTIISICTIY